MSTRSCPCCAGKGIVTDTADGGGATDGEFTYDRPCSECGGTGQRVTTHIDVGDGITAWISGNAPLSAESRDALANLMRAAYDSMREDGS